MYENNDNLEDVAKLVGSGDLLTTVKGFALSILANRSANDYPLERNDIENEISAVKLYLEGLQNPDSDLFIANNK